MLYVQVLLGVLSALILFGFYNKHVGVFMTPYDYNKIIKDNYDSIEKQLVIIQKLIDAVERNNINTSNFLIEKLDIIKYELSTLDVKVASKVQDDLSHITRSLIETIESTIQKAEPKKPADVETPIVEAKAIEKTVKKTRPSRAKAKTTTA